jgi:SAM-dependent methyltransferase/diadenosine tetraphosphate (Ap4A) HIT family hydrolase
VTSGQFVPNCDLCNEVRLAGIASTQDVYIDGAVDTYSRLVRRTSVVDVIAGLGALVPGYLLVVPRRHVLSAGELPLNELEDVLDEAREMARRIRLAFGGDVVLVEHGSSGGTSPSGACIVHAHIHLFPVPDASSFDEFLIDSSWPTRDARDLRAAAAESQNYYLVARGGPNMQLAIEPKIGSQHARRVWARIWGRENDYDWGVVLEHKTAKFTSDHLRRDTLPRMPSEGMDSKIGETIAAYNGAADWYASRTREFSPGSSMPTEIVELAGSTTGLVLDAGCGGGRDSLAFAELGRRVIALDASYDLLEHVPEHDRIERLVGDIRILPLSSTSVGAIWCSAVLLHLDRANVAQALAEFNRVLTPGGLAQVSVKEGTGSVSTNIPASPELRRHFYFYEAEDIRTLANRVGLRFVSLWYEDEADISGVVQRWVKLLLAREVASP